MVGCKTISPYIVNFFYFIKDMAPEVLLSAQFSRAADVWSYGACLIEILTDHKPYYEYEKLSYLEVFLLFFIIILTISWETYCKWMSSWWRREMNKRYQRYHPHVTQSWPNSSPPASVSTVPNDLLSSRSLKFWSIF